MVEFPDLEESRKERKMEPEEEDRRVPNWVMWVLHIVIALVAFPFLVFSVPAHIYLSNKGYLK